MLTCNINMLHVHILHNSHVDIDKSHVNIIVLHVETIYPAYSNRIIPPYLSLILVQRVKYVCKCEHVTNNRYQIRIYTNDFQFTKFIIGERRIPIWIWWVSSIVVVDDVSPIVTACYGQVVRYCRSGIACVLETRYTILFIGCIRNINGESKKSTSVLEAFTYQNEHI